MKIDSACILEDRGILFVEGQDAKDFLQNIITNDIEKVTENNSCFASLLSPQGKFLFDFIIIKHKKGYLIDCEKAQIDELYKKLSLYKLGSKLKILNLSNEFVVVALSYEKFISMNDSQDKLGFTLKFREDAILLDPRNKKLGARLIVNLEKLYLSLKKLGLHDANLKEYYSLSHKLGIVPKDLNKLQNKLFGIECNFEELNGIDFKKGCYVGQENTARIKLKEKLKKRLFAINIISGEIKKDLIIKSNEFEVGKILINEKFPFAMIQFKDKNFNFEKNFKCGEATINVVKPNWIQNL